MTKINTPEDASDFLKGFTALTAGVANLLIAGIDVNSEIIEDAVSEFLSPYAEEDEEEYVPEPVAPEKPQGPVIGHVLRRKSDGQVASFEGTTFFCGSWTAMTHLMMCVPDTEMRKNYEVVAVRADA